MMDSLVYNCILQQIYLSTRRCMSQTTNSTNLSQRTLDFKVKYKTERCRYWYERGFCPFHESCAFAHHQDELRDKLMLNQHYKTKVCTNFKKYGSCKYGERCQFLHLHEAPTVYARPSAPIQYHSTSFSEKYSESNDESIDDKHRKNITLLSNFGLDLLSLKKGPRKQEWRRFVEEGVEPKQEWMFWQEDKLKRMDFQSEFPDYDFSRKPRLGSM